MFWKFNNTSSPHFEAVLQKENVTLQELMEEDDIIQECKHQNKKLVDFLCKRNVLEELVTLITEEPSEELDERSRFKYPNIACELLTCDVPALNESLSRDNELLEKLYSFIDKDPPLNPLLASFISKTLGILIVKRLDQQWISYQFTCLQAMGFLKDKENFISLLLKHLGTSAIMDLTLKLITEVFDAEERQNLLNWLDSQNLVQSLVALFDPKMDSERQHNAAQLICDVLQISRENLYNHTDQLDTDPILARLESPETVALLLDQMLGEEKSESSIVGGIQVLLALLDHKNSTFKSRWRITDSFYDNNTVYNNYDEAHSERKQKIALSTAMVILDRLKDFHQILLDPPKKSAVKTSIETLDPPLGNTRLQVTKLLSALIALGKPELLREIMRLGIIEVLLDLFFKYAWNNFLHTQVQHCIVAALVAHVEPNMEESVNTDNVMYPYLIIKCRLIGRILEAWEDNEQKQTKPKGIRQGYMGHLINIANKIANWCQAKSSFDEFITDNVDKDTLEAWRNFVNNSLAEINKTQRVILGGIHPSNLIDDNNDDYNIPQTAVLQQQTFSDYQMQQMTPDIIENDGFHDDEFNDPDHLLQTNLEHRGNFNVLNDRELRRQADMFKKVCSEVINTFDDSDDIIFEEQNAVKSSKSTDSWDPRENNSDDEETPPVENRMDVDPWANLEENKNTVQSAILEPKDPWANLDFTNILTQQDGWADFANFTTKFFEDSTIDSSASSSAANSQIVQSSGDQNIETNIQDSANANLKADNEKPVDNHPAEPVDVPISVPVVEVVDETKIAPAEVEVPPVEPMPSPEVAIAISETGPTDRESV